MCTVSFLPIKDGFVLTSNRDERQNRARAAIPQVLNRHGMQVCAPIDPEGNGTWLAAGENGQVLCLLNGGRKGENATTTGKRSRGLLLNEYWRNPEPIDFHRSIDFSDYQAFTLILAAQNSLFVVSWNGREPLFQQLNPAEAWIWSSSTLYPSEIQQQRESWFQEWLTSTPNPGDWESVWNFHLLTKTDDPEYGLRIRRPDGKQTVSISSVRVGNEALQMRYLDLLQHPEFQSETVRLHMPLQDSTLVMP